MSSLEKYKTESWKRFRVELTRVEFRNIWYSKIFLIWHFIGDSFTYRLVHSWSINLYWHFWTLQKNCPAPEIENPYAIWKPERWKEGWARRQHWSFSWSPPWFSLLHQHPITMIVPTVTEDADSSMASLFSCFRLFGLHYLVRHLLLLLHHHLDQVILHLEEGLFWSFLGSEFKKLDSQPRWRDWGNFATW